MNELCNQAVATAPPRCPVALCHREMQPATGENNEDYDPTTGLLCFRCPSCGHRGMVAASGVQLVFQRSHQYVLTYGSHLSAMTVLLPAASIARCHIYRLDADALAKHAAEWALLSGNTSATLSLGIGEQKLLDFTCYLSSLVWPPGPTLSRASHPNVERARSEELVRG